MDGQELVELEKAIEKAENARGKAEDEYALISKFVSDKKYVYENTQKTYASVKADYDVHAEEQSKLNELLEQLHEQLDNMSTTVTEKQNEKLAAENSHRKAISAVHDYDGTDNDTLDKVKIAEKRLSEASENVSALRRISEDKSSETQSLQKKAADLRSDLSKQRNARLDELLRLIKEKNTDTIGDTKEKCRQLIEYALLLKGNISAIDITDCADTDENEGPKDCFKAVYMEVDAGNPKEMTEYLSGVTDKSGLIITQKKTAYMRDGAQLIANADGGYCVKIQGKTEKVTSPVVKSGDSFCIATGEKTRKLHDSSEDSEYGVKNLTYVYNEAQAVKEVEVVHIHGESCKIIERITTDVDITEKIRENFNIAKDAEGRKKELEKHGYEVTLNQVNSSGYKTYKVTASINRKEKMLVSYTEYSHLEIYNLVFESENVFISEKDVIDGKDGYQIKIKDLSEKSAIADREAKRAEEELDKAQKTLKDAISEAGEIESETRKARKNAEEADNARKKLMDEADSLKNEKDSAEKALMDIKKDIEAVKSKISETEKKLTAVDSYASSAKTELTSAKETMESARKDLEKAENVRDNSKAAFEKADNKLKELLEEKDRLSGEQAQNGRQSKKKGRFQDIFSAFAKE
jgi:chromosome segregation ATPase